MTTRPQTSRVGTFFTRCTLANPADWERSVTIQKLLVDTGTECTWVPAKALERIGIQRVKATTFVLANGQDVTRQVGFAVIRLDRRVAATPVRVRG
jgi:predicted aspartyl protease